MGQRGGQGDRKNYRWNEVAGAGGYDKTAGKKSSETSSQKRGRMRVPGVRLFAWGCTPRKESSKGLFFTHQHSPSIYDEGRGSIVADFGFSND
jgi:hypothetical protein